MLRYHRLVPREAIAPTLILLLATASIVPAAVAHPTPAETRREFEAICQRLQDDNIYFGDANLRGVLERLAGGPVEPTQEIQLRGQAGWEMVRLGRFLEAIEQLELALALVESHPGVGSKDFHRRISLTLAMAHFQIAEEDNCVENHSAQSCILPFASDAIHIRQTHTQMAGDVLARHMALHPRDLQSQWLLNLSRMLTDDFPDGVPATLRLPANALADDSGFPAWRNISAELAVNPLDLAGGAVIEDLDGDGLLDLVSSSSDPCKPMRAFRNDGQGGFEDMSLRWGLDSQLGGLNLVHADYDNDGAPDILVLRGAWLGDDGRIRNSLLKNDLTGDTGRFVDVTAAAGLAYPAYPTQAAGWADFDGDGDLDLLIGNESAATSTDPLQFLGKTGNVFPTQLFQNNSDGTFSDIARSSGITNRQFTKSVAWGDYDNDGDPDAYVSSFGPNQLLRNNGDRTFTDVAVDMEVTEPSRESFGSWFFDYDNDGDLDLLVVDYSSPREQVSASYLGMKLPSGHPVLYRNDGDSFQDVSTAMGFTRPLLPMGANYGDLDNDGWLDIYFGTGVPEFDALMPNVMYRNRAATGFTDVTFAGGFGHLQKGHGIAFGDIDNDGDQDLYHQLGGAFPCDDFNNALFENPDWPNRWIVLQLRGTQANRFGVGARIAVRVRTGELRRTVHLLAGTGGSFGSSSLQQEIGLGDAEAIESILIVWPGSRLQQEFQAVELDAFYRATEGNSQLEKLSLPRIDLASQDSVTPHNHHEGGDE